MRVLLTAALWSLAAWFWVDLSAYALGFSRQVTPLIAALVGIAVAGGLTRARARGASAALAAPAPGLVAEERF